MDKSYYDKQYFQDRIVGQQGLTFVIDRFLQKIRAKKVLDVACGSGWLIKSLQKRKTVKFFGCDIADEAVKLTKTRVSSPSLIKKGAATKLPYSNRSFDVVMGISLVEHLTKVEAVTFFQESHRVLKTKGWFFLVTPNLTTPLRLLKRLEGKAWIGSADPTHINLYTPWRLKKELKENHFNNFQLMFPFSPKVPFDWGFPQYIENAPKQIRNLITFLILSTPFYLIRFSIWLAAQKNEK